MISARTNTLANLRGRIERLEAPGETHAFKRVPLGHAGADAMLRGGLAVGAMHEVFSEGRQSGTATGFIAGLAGRLTARRPLVWVRQDFSEIESGALSMSGLAELGLDPRRLVSVHAADVDAALRTAADALACDAVGAVVLEVWGEARQLDLVASRKLTLAAQASGVTCLVLRVAAEPSPSTAETRWIVQAARSPPTSQLGPAAALRLAAAWGAWGAPVFDAQLVRHRHGPVGRWIMEWKCDECLFSEPAAYPQPVAAAPAHRSHQARTPAQQRRAG
jgi:protein ImuA